MDKPLVLPVHMVWLAELKSETAAGRTYFQRIKEQRKALDKHNAKRRGKGRSKTR